MDNIEEHRKNTQAVIDALLEYNKQFHELILARNNYMKESLKALEDLIKSSS